MGWGSNWCSRQPGERDDDAKLQLHFRREQHSRSYPFASIYFECFCRGGLNVGVSINAANVTSAIDIGFLGASVNNGTIELNAQVSNTNAVGGLGTLPSGAPNLSTTGSLNLTLPLLAQLGSQNASGTLSISSTNLATMAPAVQFTGFSGWQNFTSVSNDDVLQMLSQLGGQLGQLATQTWTANLPLLGNLSLAQVANLNQVFQDAVSNQISSWNVKLQQIDSNFVTAQDLVNQLAQVLDVTPSSINVQFNPITNSLTFQLSLMAHPFTNLLAQTLQLNLDQGGFANTSITGSRLSFSSTVTTNLTFGMYLAPLGGGFVLTPQTLLSALNGGAGMPTNGKSAADLQVTLSNGTSFQVSLNGAKTVQDVINAIESASNGTVEVTIDSYSP